MTPDELVHLQEMQASNRRMVQELDAYIADLKQAAALHALSSNSPGNQGVAEGQSPYFYGAIGRDGQPGVIIGDQAEQPTFAPLIGAEPRRNWYGNIQIQNDAPFVWTHLMATACVETKYSRTANPEQFPTTYGAFGAINGSGRPRGSRTLPRLDIGFTETSSGRVLYQSNRFDPPTTSGELLPAALFDTMREFQIRGSNAAVSGAAFYSAMDSGHGPSTLFELPAEVLIPKNGVVEVALQTLGIYNDFLNTEGSYASQLPRVFVTMLGYKIIEE